MSHFEMVNPVDHLAISLDSLAALRRGMVSCDNAAVWALPDGLIFLAPSDLWLSAAGHRGLAACSFSRPGGHRTLLHRMLFEEFPGSTFAPLFHLGSQLGFGGESDVPVDHLAVFEDHQHRDRGDTVVGGRLWILVDVDLADLVILGQRFD